MDIERLKSYTATKKPADRLTKEERDKIMAVLNDVNEAGNTEWQSAEECLLKLPDVMYDFICGAYSDLKDERKKELYSLLMGKVNQGSPRTVIYAAVALNKCGETQKAEELLRRFVYNRWNKTKPDANKSIINAFCNAASITGGDFLFTKREDWKLSPLRIYAEMLNAFIERDYSDSNVELIKGWYECNESAKGEDEEKKFLEILDEKKNAVPQTNDLPTKAQKLKAVSKKKAYSSKPGAEDPDKYIDDFCAEIKCQLKALKSEKCKLESEVRSLESEKQDALRKNEAELKHVETLEKEKSVLNSRLDEVSRNLRTEQNARQNAERLGMEKQSKLDDTESELEKTKSELNEMSNKYSLVTDSYNQAGKAELEMLTAEISRRLSNDHAKFLQIKSMGRSLDCYDILVDILEKTYRVLSNNGINFDA